MDTIMTNTAVITFGRFNPITIGHEKLVNKVKSFANDFNADPLVFLSHSYDNRKNPIDYVSKFFYANKAFGDCVQFSTARNLIDVAKQLNDKYDNLCVVVGSDRLFEFEELLNKYNRMKDHYDYEEITVLSAGKRDSDNAGVEGISASKLRSYAINNNVIEFENGLPLALREHSNDILNLVRKRITL